MFPPHSWTKTGRNISLAQANSVNFPHVHKAGNIIRIHADCDVWFPSQVLFHGESVMGPHLLLLSNRTLSKLVAMSKAAYVYDGICG